MEIPRYRILYVEDDEDHFIWTRQLASLSTQSRLELEWVPEYATALASMTGNHHDAYLLDYRLGETSGMNLLQDAILGGCRRPVIMLTAFGNETLDQQAIQAGAADYLVKGQINGDLLERSIRYAIERQRTADALWASREYARNIVDSSLDMIVAVDLERRVTTFNQAAQRTFGFRVDEMIGGSIDRLYADPDEGSRVANHVLAEGGYSCEVVNRRGDGTLFPSYLAASPIRDAAGAMVGIMGISRDITEQKQAEKAIHQLNEKLEERVRLRTSQLEASNAELRDQMVERKKAELDRELVIRQLQDALSQVKTLSGLIPICAHCKKIRDDRGYWNQVEEYIRRHSHAEFTHGICPDCMTTHFPGYARNPEL